MGTYGIHLVEINVTKVCLFYYTRRMLSTSKNLNGTANLSLEIMCKAICWLHDSVNAFAYVILYILTNDLECLWVAESSS